MKRLPLNKKQLLWDAVGYAPNPLALDVHTCSNRVVMVAGGERAGKSRSAAAEAFPHCLMPDSLGWIVGPTYELARQEFNYILGDLGKLGMVQDASTPAHGAMSLTTRTGGKVVTRSADDPVKLASVAPDWVLMCEAAQCSYETYLRLRGRVAEKRGWLWISGTFEGSLGWYPELWSRWQADNVENARSYSLPTWSNTQLFPAGREDAEIIALEKAYPADVFQERFGAIPCPPSNLVLKEFSHTEHIRTAPYWSKDRAWVDKPVELWIDPGGAGHYAVLAVQVNGYEVQQIDEVCVEYGVAEEIIGVCQARPWWALVKSGVMDIAGQSKDGRESHADIWKRVARIPIGAKRVGVDEGIQRHRTFLRDSITGLPNLYHDPRCTYTIREYGLYKRNADTGKIIDRDNHAMKAIAYGLVYNFGIAEPTLQRLPQRYQGEAMEQALARIYG